MNCSGRGEGMLRNKSDMPRAATASRAGPPPGGGDWPPNWQDNAAYPEPSTTSSTEWAWEFLRRRPDYQRDYEALVKLAIAEDGSIGDRRLLRLVRERYGLSFPLAPNRPVGPNAQLLFFDNYVPELRSWHNNELQSVSVKPGTVFIQFDLAQPIPAQLARAAQVLSNDQRHYLQTPGRAPLKLRQRSEKWRIYLRLLDAEAVGASIAEMAKGLFPRVLDEYPEYAASDSVRKLLRAAKRVRSRYRAIAGLETPGK